MNSANTDLYNKFVFYYDNDISSSFNILYKYFPNLKCSYEDWCLFCFKNSSEYHNKTVYPNHTKFRYLYDYYNDYYNEDLENKYISTNYYDNYYDDDYDNY